MERSLVWLVLLGSVQWSPVRCTEHIIGGETAIPTDYKWMAAIFRNGKFICGGTLISFNWVLTACHCVHDKPPDQFIVIMGANDITKTRETSRQSRQPTSIVEHSDFNKHTFENDIALFYFAHGFRQTNRVDTVRVPQDMENFQTMPANLTGWGLRDVDPVRRATALRHADFTIINNDYCAVIFPGVIQRSNMCTWQFQTRSFCTGDSGSGLTLFDGGAFYVVGIVSFSTPSCRAGGPGVYADVAWFANWIRSYTGVR